MPSAEVTSLTKDQSGTVLSLVCYGQTYSLVARDKQRERGLG